MYLTGSYARSDQENDSDIDIIAISKSTSKKISSGRYNLEIIPLKNILSLLKKNPIQIYPRMREAKPILNQGLLDEIKAIHLPPLPWKSYLQECKQAIKSSKELIQYDKKKKNARLTSDSIVYSTMLRLRGIYIIHLLASERRYSKKEFQEWIMKETYLSEEELKKVYEIYKQVRAGMKVRESIEITVAEKILNMLEKEVKIFEKKKET
jgi:hypothetical protein